jgi:hypothetical protein
MVLLELFDAHYPYEVTRKTERNFSAVFTSDNGHTVLFFIDRAGPAWDAGFSQNLGTRENPKWSTLITGKGDEYRIFGTIMKIMSDFIKEYQPEMITFTAEKSEGDRNRLYDKMVKRHVPAGYEYDISHNSSDYRSYFVLKRKDT